jgi:hypothetical protein
LFGEDLITNLFAVLPNVGTFAHHELVAHYTNGKVVSCIGMIFSADDFW